MPTHAGINAALALVIDNNLKPEYISEVVIHVGFGQVANFYYAKPFSIRDFPQGDAAFSYIYTVATALVNKSVFIQNFSEQAIRDPRVQSMIKKIKMAERPEGAELGVQVDLRLADGRRLSQYKAEPREFAVNPTPRDEVIAKFRKQVAYAKTISDKKAESALELLQDLENLKNVNRLLKYMAA